jgi:aspartyl-tRNA(Asn)/glutamyl-tRNA(Gln) amidotransferase subunit A
MLQAMAGHDSRDPTSARSAVPNMIARCDGSLARVRVGVPGDYFFDNLDPDVRTAVIEALNEIARAGARLVDINLPLAEAASAATTVIYRSEGFAYHEEDLRTRSQLFGRYTRRGLQLGAMFSASDYVHAQRLRRVVTDAWDKAMEAVDVLVIPTLASTAPKFEGYDPDGLVSRPEFTGAFNLTGYPALSIPCGFSAIGLPIGMQIVGKAFEEPVVLGIGDAYQGMTDFHKLSPPAFSW